MIAIRRVESDADLEAWAAVKSAVEPEEPMTAEQLRQALSVARERLMLLVELDGVDVAAGLADRSDDPRRAFVMPRVLAPHRGRGIGAALLRPLIAHAESLGVGTVGSRVHGRDGASLAFAEHFGFHEVRRDVEQVREIGEETPPPLPEGVEVVSIEERPELLREAYGLSLEAYPDLAVAGTIEISLERWLVEEATRPGGSFVALAGDELVAYAGLLQVGDETDVAEHGLTAVRRAWRRRGIATLLKQTQAAWAAQHGVRRLITWTQRGNEAMQAVNERLGYVTTAETIAVQADLPLAALPRS